MIRVSLSLRPKRVRRSNVSTFRVARYEVDGRRGARRGASGGVLAWAFVVLNLQGFANAVAYGLTDRHRALLVDWLCPRRADRAAPDVGVDIADKDEEGGALAPSC